jgi:hypothetical protein
MPLVNSTARFIPMPLKVKQQPSMKIALSPFCYAESHQSVLFICGERTNKESGVGQAKHFFSSSLFCRESYKVLRIYNMPNLLPSSPEFKEKEREA